MEIQMEKHKIESADLKKCGEITTHLSIGQKEFFLNCSFCDYIFLQLGDFIQHICEDHLCHFMNPKVQDEDDNSLQEDIEQDNNFSTTVSNEEGMDDGVAQFSAADSNEDSDDSKTNLQDFEKVEIQLDDNQVKKSMGFKDLNESETEKNYIDNEDDVENSEIAVHLKENYTCEKNTYKGCNTENSEIASFIEELGLNGSFNKNKMLAIFEGYEKRPFLWDNDLQLPRDNKKREKEIKNIAEEVGIPSEWESIRKMIAKLSSKLRTELVRKKVYLSKGKIYTPLWINDFAMFLKPKRKKAKVKPKPLLRKFTTPETILNDEQAIVLAKIYNSLSTLWDETEITYRFSNRRREALQMLLKDFNKQTGLNLTKYDMECEISRLRKLVSNEKRKKFVCKRQNKIFKPSCTFYSHIAFLETDVSPYECPICEKLFSGTQQCKVHLASHDGSLPFKCHICGHGFKLMTNLTVHLRRHAHDYLYKCEMCDKPCATTTELRTHMRCHTGEKPYVCEICGKKYRSLAELRPHKLRHDKKPRCQCEICNKTFYMRSLLTKHMRVHTAVRDKLCSICKKGFTSNQTLQQHMLIHSSEKKYTCNICGKRFAQYAGLSGHVKSHGTTLIEISSKSVDLVQEDQE
ncbi:zinc finger protein 492-like isoform X2 [Bactrocera tryoni]|uniref:zinc finger protein 492-like isoform X2 n=1 Tax=Bactrocera tryoni TaxID=59916 RepID=UPI001A97D5A0|nr:zinc finger protein 492-like isoform X2 [Bactrocera tryoni]